MPIKMAALPWRKFRPSCREPGDRFRGNDLITAVTGLSHQLTPRRSACRAATYVRSPTLARDAAGLPAFDEPRRSAAVLIASPKAKSRPTHLCRRRSPEGRMRWSFRIFREEYLRGSYVCQVEPLSKSSVLRVPETPPGGQSPLRATRGRGLVLANDTPLAPVTAPRSFYDEQSCPGTMLCAAMRRPVLAVPDAKPRRRA